MTRQYNYIYSKLVEDEYDVLGLIAYGLYKSDKIQYIKKITEEKGKPPSEEELDFFHKSSESHIVNYENRAMTISLEFLEQALYEKIQEVEEDHEEKLLGHVKNLRPKWWPAIMQSFIGAFFFALCIGLTFFVIVGVRIGFWEAFESCGYLFTAPTPQYQEFMNDNPATPPSKE